MRRVLIVCGLILLTGAAVFGGMQIRKMTVKYAEVAQPGWCCFPQQKECRGALGSGDCTNKGGTSFSWDAASCNAICLQ